MENENKIKLDIRPLEIDNLFTIRHLNAFVNSYFIANQKDNTTGKIIIEINVDGGVEELAGDANQLDLNYKEAKKKKLEKKGIEEVDPNDVVIPEGAVKLSLVYNENVIKLSPNPNSALELTLKFSVNNNSFFLLNKRNEIIPHNQGSQIVSERNSGILNKSTTDPSGEVLSKSTTDTSGDFLNKSKTDPTGVALG